ncbi:MAG: tripartite tricarboxylate transporter substrate binding protein [Betaproteobacteria bacterium]|nr:tripartite tricarboxylate transporter substrate binding protein [Betaproteobacteria bacterium]MBI3057600.1 tripartite tricarboxylate transporter substrate binding protein [Betaproteobacteria bacterium]
MLLVASAGACWAQGVASGAAAGYPAKPIRMIVALAAGGGVDTSGRILGQKFTDAWGQQVVADNRPGAGGTIATEMVARATPDGYTLLMVSMGHAITPALYKLSYDTIKDFAPISLFVQSPSILAVHPSLPAKNVQELIAFVKPRPGEILFSSSGSGSGQHLAMELLNRMAGLQLVHIPYKGTAPSILDLVAGRVSVTSASAISTMPHVRAGRLRALAVSSAKRSPSVPELPTVAEAGIPGFAVDQWYSLFAPAGTPKEIVAKLYGEIAKTVAHAGTRERLLAMGLDPVGMPPAEFAAYVKTETVKWGKLVHDAGIRVN